MSNAGLFTDGEAYERLMGRWSRRAGAAMLDWLDPPPGLDWLDAGCGNGAFTAEIVASCAPRTVMGIDPSPQQIAYAQARVDIGAARFALGDAQALDLPAASVDIATMALVLAFLPDPAAALASLRRVVRPGGRIAAYMWDVEGGGMPRAPLYAAMAAEALPPPVFPNAPASDLATMAALWREAGLLAVETCVICVPTEYDSFEAFWEANTVPIGPQGAVLARLSPPELEGLRERLLDILQPDEEGRIRFEATCNAVTGVVPEQG